MQPDHWYVWHIRLLILIFKTHPGPIVSNFSFSLILVLILLFFRCTYIFTNIIISIAAHIYTLQDYLSYIKQNSVL